MALDSLVQREDAGGSRNASTGPDHTNYFETVPANQLEAMLWAHAERMGRSVLDQTIESHLRLTERRPGVGGRRAAGGLTHFQVGSRRPSSYRRLDRAGRPG